MTGMERKLDSSAACGELNYRYGLRAHILLFTLFAAALGLAWANAWHPTALPNARTYRTGAGGLLLLASWPYLASWAGCRRRLLASTTSVRMYLLAIAVVTVGAAAVTVLVLWDAPGFLWVLPITLVQAAALRICADRLLPEGA